MYQWTHSTLIPTPAPHSPHLRPYCCSVAKWFLTLCDPVGCSSQASLSFTIFQSSLKLMPIESMMLSNHLTLCHPLLLLPSVFPSIYPSPPPTSEMEPPCPVLSLRKLSAEALENPSW